MALLGAGVQSSDEERFTAAGTGGACGCIVVSTGEEFVEEAGEEEGELDCGRGRGAVVGIERAGEGTVGELDGERDSGDGAIGISLLK